MIGVGDRVRLISLPDWLLRGLPEDEQLAMRKFVGGVTDVTDIDAFGYLWIGFGETNTEGVYFGQSFCVPKDCLEKIGDTGPTSPAAA